MTSTALASISGKAAKRKNTKNLSCDVLIQFKFNYGYSPRAPKSCHAKHLAVLHDRYKNRVVR